MRGRTLNLSCWRSGSQWTPSRDCLVPHRKEQWLSRPRRRCWRGSMKRSSTLKSCIPRCCSLSQEVLMPILREWRGVIRKTERDAYVAYIRGTGIADYRNTPGNLGALMAVNDLDAERTEVVTLSLWSSWDAIRAFAGESPELARYYPEDDRFLLERPRTVKHYEAFGELSTAQAT